MELTANEEEKERNKEAWYQTANQPTVSRKFSRIVLPFQLHGKVKG